MSNPSKPPSSLPLKGDGCYTKRLIYILPSLIGRGWGRVFWGKVLLLFLFSSCCSLRPGYLLFHQSPVGNAITDVTPAMTDHVAIYAGHDLVVEAIPDKGVVLTPLDTLLSREPGTYTIGRVRSADRQRSVANAMSYLALPYDSLFLPGSDAIYCSELVQLSYVDRHGNPVFATIPMSFHDSTGRVTPYWQQFYQRHHLSVPEGEPGTNPGEMMQRQQVRVKKMKR